MELDIRYHRMFRKEMTDHDDEDAEDESDDISNLVCDKFEKLKIVGVSSTSDDGDVASNLIDGNLKTRLSSQGDDQSINLELESISYVADIGISVYKGSDRKALFDIGGETTDGELEDVILEGESLPGTGMESYDMGIETVKYVRLTGYGYDDIKTDKHGAWSSYTEIEL